jgi:hypothetical protein
VPGGPYCPVQDKSSFSLSFNISVGPVPGGNGVISTGYIPGDIGKLKSKKLYIAALISYLWAKMKFLKAK